MANSPDSDDRTPLVNAWVSWARSSCVVYWLASWFGPFVSTKGNPPCILGNQSSRFPILTTCLSLVVVNWLASRPSFASRNGNTPWRLGKQSSRFPILPTGLSRGADIGPNACFKSPIFSDFVNVSLDTFEFAALFKSPCMPRLGKKACLFPNCKQKKWKNFQASKLGKLQHSYDWIDVKNGLQLNKIFKNLCQKSVDRPLNSILLKGGKFKRIELFLRIYSFL